MGISKENLFAEYDREMNVSDAVRYAEEHFSEFLSAREEANETVYTTNSNWLGLASPSLVDYRVIGGRKRGRVLKKPVKEGDRYDIITYGADGRPISVTHVNEFGTKDTYFFFDFEGFTWAMELSESDKPQYRGKHLYGDVFKYAYDPLGRIIFLAEITGASIQVEKYEYYEGSSDNSLKDSSEKTPEEITGVSSYPASSETVTNGLSDPASSKMITDVSSRTVSSGSNIICYMYYYVPNLSGSDKSIPAGFKGTPMSEYRYEISAEQDIREYVKKENDYAFIREIKRTKAKKTSAPKPVDGSYESFETWLDGEVEKFEFATVTEGAEKDNPLTPRENKNDHLPLTNSGAFFLLFGPNEDGFGITLQLCPSFDPEDDDWACNPTYSSSMHMIQTTGECEEEAVIRHASALLKKYLRSGARRKQLKAFSGIGIGFSDGEIVYL